MTSLIDLGFLKDVIVETIVSTYNTDGQPNAAPMGAIMQNEEQILIRLFNSSSTYKNLQSVKCATINLTSNIQLFYLTSFKDGSPLPSEWFERAQTINAPILQLADASIETSVVNVRKINEEKTEVKCNVKFVNAKKMDPKAYCRAQFAAMEAIIHATRVKVFLNGDEKQKKQAATLLQTIEICREIVDRCAPNTQYAQIMADLNKMIDSWRNPNEGVR